MERDTEPVSKLDAGSTKLGDPFIRIAAAAPFLDFCKKRNVDVMRPLRRFALTGEDLLDTERIVHAEVVYGLFNALSIAADDPYLGIHVGEEVRLIDWAFNRHSLEDNPPLGTALVSMVQGVPKYGSSVQHEFVVGAELSEYRVLRPLQTRNEPLQSDGLGVAMRLKMFDQLEGGWDPKQVSVQTQFPGAIPKNYRGVRILQAETAVLGVSFPTEWCHRRIVGQQDTAPEDAPGMVPPSLRSALEGVVPDLLTEPSSELKERIALTLGLSLSDIETALRRQSTSLTKEIRRVRVRLAKKGLATSTMTITELAYQLGFSDAANFTRFFKNETGSTPRAFRKDRQSLATEPSALLTIDQVVTGGEGSIGHKR